MDHFHRFRATYVWLLASLCLFGFAACSGAPPTGEVIAGAAAGLGAGLTAIANSVAPALDAEQGAKLIAGAGRADSIVQAVGHGLGALADAFAAMKGTIGTQVVELKAQIAGQADLIAAQKATLAQHASALDSVPTRTETLTTNGGVGAAAIAADRYLSALKHGPRKPA